MKLLTLFMTVISIIFVATASTAASTKNDISSRLQNWLLNCPQLTDSTTRSLSLAQNGSNLLALLLFTTSQSQLHQQDEVRNMFLGALTLSVLASIRLDRSKLTTNQLSSIEFWYYLLDLLLTVFKSSASLLHIFDLATNTQLFGLLIFVFVFNFLHLLWTLIQ